MVDSNRKKSPRAPSLSLGEALERVIKIYESEGLHHAPTDVVAQALGYKSANNGAALSVLASLRYFGLVERPKDGFLCVNKNVEAYKFAPDENLRRSLVIGFLKMPPLYNELLERYAVGLPSDANLRFELIQKGFSPQSSEPILSAFKESVAFANYYDGKADPVVVSEAYPARERPNRQAAENDSESESPVLDLSPQINEEKSDPDRIPVRLSGGRKAWLIIPSPFFDADKVRLKAQIDLILSEEE